MSCYKVQGEPGEFESVYSPEPLQDKYPVQYMTQADLQPGEDLYNVGKEGHKFVALRSAKVVSDEVEKSFELWVPYASFDTPGEAFEFVGRMNGYSNT